MQMIEIIFGGEITNKCSKFPQNKSIKIQLQFFQFFDESYFDWRNLKMSEMGP